MNSRQRRKLRRFSERMYKAVNIGDVCWCVEPAWLDARPWIDVTGDGEAPPYMLFEKDQQPNGHDLGKVFESIFKSVDSGDRPTAASAALERYVERELLSAKPGESILSAAKRAEKVPPKPPKMEVVKD